VTRAILILVLLAFIVVVGLSFVGGESADARREVVAPVDQPGYFLTGATITDTSKDGTERVRIRAERIEQLPRDNSVQLESLNLVYRGNDTRAWVVTADRGRVPEASKVVHLEGNVRIHAALSDPGPEAVIDTDSLDFDTDTSIAHTDDEVRVAMGMHALTARGLTADLKQGRVRLESSVHGKFNPPFTR
jgi:LPS export ABC transporter protein LptC